MNIILEILQALGLVSYDDQTPALVPVVTVKIVDSLPMGLGQGETLTISQLAAKVGLDDTAPPVTKISSAYSGAVLARMLEPLDPVYVDGLVNVARQNDPTYEPVNLNNFLEIVCPLGFDTDSLVAALQAWSGVVEFAGRNPVAQAATVTGTGNTYFKSEDYLSALNGVNAPAAWAKGADGTGIRVVDIEGGWFLKHQDFLPKSIPIIFGESTNELAHGTMTLGVIMAQDNNIGVVGMAPNANIQVSSAMYRETLGPEAGQWKENIGVALAAAAIGQSAGDVLLLEWQLPTKTTQGNPHILPFDIILPLEAFLPYRRLIQTITANSFVVVEPAGNGSVNLDTYVDDNGRHIFNRGMLGEYDESGAIMVGAGAPVKSPRWLPQPGYDFTNYGSRVDCCAWGAGVATCWFDPNAPYLDNLYKVGPDDIKDFFTGTSAASAMIAGCCALIQHLQTMLTPKNTKGKLNSRQMRAIVSKPANCSPPGAANGATGGDIGAMPDLGLIIANEYQP